MDEHIRDLINRYFEGAASTEDESAIRKWLESSSDNKRDFLKERKLYDTALLSGSEIGCGSDAHGRVRFAGWAKEILKIAAVFAIVLGLDVFYGKYKQSNEEPLYQTLYVPAGQRTNILLPDGTDVWLNTCTTLRYPVSFGKKERTVELDGEAYFNVAKDEKSPFVVKTPAYNVEALGTEFNVAAYSGRPGFEAMLVEGKVRISSALDPDDNVVLLPAHKAYVQNGKLETAHVDDYASYSSWKEGLIHIDKKPFVEIMHDFEKYYGLKIRIENEEVKNQSYSGKFRQADGIDYALRVLQKDIPFVYGRDDESSEIVISK